MQERGLGGGFTTCRSKCDSEFEIRNAEVLLARITAQSFVGVFHSSSLQKLAMDNQISTNNRNQNKETRTNEKRGSHDSGGSSLSELRSAMAEGIGIGGRRRSFQELVQAVQGGLLGSRRSSTAGDSGSPQACTSAIQFIQTRFFSLFFSMFGDTRCSLGAWVSGATESEVSPVGVRVGSPQPAQPARRTQTYSMESPPQRGPTWQARAEKAEAEARTGSISARGKRSPHSDGVSLRQDPFPTSSPTYAPPPPRFPGARSCHQKQRKK